jgi:ABC-2 type transport system ATP-binding protein
MKAQPLQTHDLGTETKVVIRMEELSKSFGSVMALQPTSIQVREGELFGLIGPDGAGKTTLIRMLTTLLLPDGGRASVLGMDVVREFRSLRKRIGYMPGRFSLYQDLSVHENLAFFASIFGTTIEANYELIKDVYAQIEPFATRRAGALSGGMKQKLALSCALIHRPDILFLDEPTTGVDAVSRREFWDMLGKLRLQGLTIFVSTPYMDEASRCDRIALMLQGRILKTDSPQAIRAGFVGELYAVKSSQTYALLTALRTSIDLAAVYPFGDAVHVTQGEVKIDLESYLDERGISATVTRIEPSVEDVFLAMTGAGTSVSGAEQRLVAPGGSRE